MEKSSRRSWPALRRTAPVLVAIAVLAVGGAVWSAARASAAVPGQTRCYEGSDPRTLEGDVQRLTLGTADPGALDPVGACAELWRHGVLDGTAQVHIGATAPAPALIACRAADGTPVVFRAPEPDPPSAASFCRDLGDHPWQG